MPTCSENALRRTTSEEGRGNPCFILFVKRVKRNSLAPIQDWDGRIWFQHWITVFLFLLSEWVSVETSLRLIRVQCEEVVEEILGFPSLATGCFKETAEHGGNFQNATIGALINR
jgi:hypothetical protein